ncbi:putative regulator of Ras-like GTPase activity (Roadblock/LC7/MglB family) [Nocardia kruczakiae]|uniref:Regulator of Ras-like GTPase activity (Roadblock/LC7/MglB family) n=1 Tax=Nocardia kruczakiae TaxID=261477 RepID=A0ABU1X8N3_9NOCA|nr:roadblock/LC7 domain-containing protein [Nocardia kruczakiae]MDR7166896.1 putative regulator of Ras-like GTPase activity (Roadblock/LC7/MglB family) [Nocardia kruczakiae]
MNEYPSTAPAPAGLDWILDKLVSRVSGAEGAVVLSADGLPMAGSGGLGRENVEHLAAIASALHSLARGVGSHFGKGELHQTVIELELGFLVVTEAGNGACLALLADIEADLGLIAYEMNVIIGQVREHLSAVPRMSETVAPPYQP